ncbi:MAG: PSD1 and planctomycete cytochrome C domain-containing protein [Fuerstiella sp.]|nr:PSD1 and planctomycete cytochrome C domain-containing protein [Fuerstiella sp.]
MKDTILMTTVLLAFAGEFCQAADVNFSRDIRPLLSDKCFRCHGPDDGNRQADLRLDVRSDAVAAGAIKPNNPKSSELLNRITSDDPNVRMPPPSTEKMISEEETELLLTWIQEGAEYSRHWAFESPERPELPSVRNNEWIRNPIDRFVLAKLESQKMSPSEPADRVTLIRRLYLDLLGLPPSPASVDTFLSDTRNNSFQNLLEQIFKSEHFGERWGRWWLDAARYADSDGYEKDKQRSVWFYRDWVIAAMNDDMPYDEFVIQQIAGDLLPAAGQSELVATGFLRNSMVNEEGGADPEQFRVEGMFDRMDAIGKAILGITTQCAQCHTHKYDPLSQREYYRMFAALNNFHEATATVFTPSQDQQRQHVLNDIAEIETDIKRRVPDWKDQLSKWTQHETEKLVDWRIVIPTDRPYSGQKFRILNDGSIISESYAPTKTNDTFSLRTTAENLTAFRLDVLTHPQLPRSGPGRSVSGTGALSSFEVSIAPADAPDEQQKIKLVRAWADINPAHSDLPLIYREKDADSDTRVTGPIQYAIDGDDKTAWTTDNGPGRRNRNCHAVFFPEHPVSASGEVILSFTLRQRHGGWNSDDNQNYLLGRYQFSVTESDTAEESKLPSLIEAVLQIPKPERTVEHNNQLFSYWRTTVSEFAEDNTKIEQLWKRFPEAESQLVVRSRSTTRTTHILTRGDFLNPGEQVTSGTPAFLHAFPKSSEPDRLRFAKWLVSDEAPTTARVIVNRIWQAYFGRGIVSTPEDFGFQSPGPTHPKLIDWLAVELMENQWSLKHIHRLIVNSATYRQAAGGSPEQRESDPYNELLGRAPRTRVDAELVRDIALTASGLLNRVIGGPSVYPPAPEFLFQPPASYGPKHWYLSTDDQQYRRSLYIHGYRSVPYPAMQLFDAPKGDTSCVRRPRSNTPLQALVLLNEPQFVQCAQAMAVRVLRESDPEDSQRLSYAHRLCVSRSPTQAELQILQTLLDQQRTRISANEIDVDKLINGLPGTERQLTTKQARNLAPWIVVCRAILNIDETITRQ